MAKGVEKTMPTQLGTICARPWGESGMSAGEGEEQLQQDRKWTQQMTRVAQARRGARGAILHGITTTKRRKLAN